ncbi:MAG: hypothetical protein A2571_01280 [Candidatus Vogelbacteria bacterium RIFOXYD1_FULL_44_32]|uniref:Uncharacterized protein n=1 Tax=Candidatus Vogelbacteria bacterium RIFOXYD1_FULL_44_32 TaxID=1802438 RepID=A0A1G2QCT3_9BACT|nr:MAG: hypothetical protein A2571_01280 [Candidatus Vogelbacteria bacterium RIFOXYD1_FULL_44_32]
MLKDFFKGLASLLLVIVFFWGGIWLSLDSILPPVEVTRSWPNHQVIRVRVVEGDCWVTKPAVWLQTYDGPITYLWGPSVEQLAEMK